MQPIYKNTELTLTDDMITVKGLLTLMNKSINREFKIPVDKNVINKQLQNKIIEHLSKQLIKPITVEGKCIKIGDLSVFIAIIPGSKEMKLTPINTEISNNKLNTVW